MKQKRIILRKDHEVYFIQKPDSLKRTKIHTFVLSMLSELHPGFSSDTSVDIKPVVLNNTCWLMVTVIASEVLTEYRILWKDAILYTNTSIMVHNKDFINIAPYIVDDELIGYDKENNKPVSLPLDGSGPNENQKHTLSPENIPTSNSVFSRKKKVTFSSVIAIL